MRAYLLIAFHNLVQARRRTLLLGLAIALVTLLLIGLGALSRGFETSLREGATALVSGHVNIGGWYKNKETDAWPMISDVAALERIVRETVPDLEGIVARDRAWAKAISRQHSFYVSPSGVDITTESRLRAAVRLAPEREYVPGAGDVVRGDLSRLAERNTVAIFASQAKRLAVGIGDFITLTAPTGSGRTNTIDVTVVAVLRDVGFMSGWNLFVPSSAIHELYETDDGTSSVLMLYLKDVGRAEAVMGELRVALAAAGYTLMDHDPRAFFFKFEGVAGEDWTGQKLDLTIWSDEVSYISWVSTVIDTVTALLIGTLMAIIAMGIMNAMWMSVRRRTAEIGTARAIGMTRGGVLGMFVTEALMLGFVATTFGALLGVVLAIGIDAAGIALDDQGLSSVLMSDTLRLQVGVEQVVTAIVVFTLVTGLAAISPAIRAARLQPVSAMQNH